MRIGYLSLTTFCPNRCLACPCRHAGAIGSKELDLERIREDVRKAEEQGPLDRVILSGGEPTFHGRFLEVMAFLASRTFPVSLTTTSERFSDPDFLRRVLEAFPAKRLSVTTAFHSFDPEVHDAMTRTTGSLRRWKAGLLAAEAAGVATTLKHLLSRPTIEALPRFVEAYYREFAPSTGLYLCSMDFSGSAAANREQVYLSFREIRRRLEPALDFVRERRTAGDARQVWVLDLPLCAADEPYHVFFPDGRQQADAPVFYDAPDLESVRFSDSLAPQRSVPGDVCAPCRLKDRCRGTWTSAAGRHPSSDYRPFPRGSAHA